MGDCGPAANALDAASLAEDAPEWERELAKSLLAGAQLRPGSVRVSPVHAIRCAFGQAGALRPGAARRDAAHPARRAAVRGRVYAAILIATPTVPFSAFFL